MGQVLLRWAGVAAVAAALALYLGAQEAQRLNQYRVTTYWDASPTDPRVLMRGPRGRIWVGSGDGTVRILEDPEGDGVACGEKIFVQGTWGPHGLACKGTGGGWDVYVAHIMAPYGGSGRITRFVDKDGDDTFEEVHTVITNFPLGAHQVNNIALSKDGAWLYFAVGATSDKTPGAGALVGRVSATATDLPWGDKRIQVVATGLRNAWGLAFHPRGELFATDNGQDEPVDKAPHDELNLILPGKDYGFPAVGGMPPPGHASEPPVGLLDVHSSANGLTFDDGDALTGFRNQVFIALWGSWLGSPDSTAGTGIIQAALHRDGKGRWHFRPHKLLAACGRPLDVEMGPEGDLFFTVQTSGPGWPEGVYRLTSAHGIALKLEGVPEPGAEISVKIHAPARIGHLYRIGISGGQGPIPTSLGPLALSPDGILRWSAAPGEVIRFQVRGAIQSTGVSKGPDVIRIPPADALSGRTFYVAAVTFDPDTGRLTGVSPTAVLDIL